MTEGWVITHKTGSQGSKLWKGPKGSWCSLNQAKIYDTEQAAKAIAAYWHVVMSLSEAQALVTLEGL